MELTKKQKDYIDSLITETITESNLSDFHETIYESCLDNYIIDLDDISEDLYDDSDEIYSNLVWDYLESKI
jgi:hypothetical protein